MKWTSEQLAAIQTTGQDLLVSAAAGSGKTAVLAQRCAYLICDAPEKCDVDELLVVTFTNAAAAEMRTRIEAALRARPESASDSRLQKQLRLLERAQISTIHGFCTSILRQQFHAVDLDPNFRVLDEEEVNLLKREIGREMLDDRYETDSSGEFQRLIDLYGNGEDEFVLRHIIRLHNLLGSMVDPDGWLNDANARIAQAINAKRLAGSDLGRELCEQLADWLDDLSSQWLRLADETKNLRGLERYVDYIGENLAAVKVWQRALEKGNFDALAQEIEQFESERLPAISNTVEHKERVQAAINSIRDQMTKSGPNSMARFSEQQWRDGLISVQRPTELFIELTQEFTSRYARVKRELRGVDFTDLERLALQALSTAPADGQDILPSEIARAYQRQFKHVLVDEYQDINQVQDAILSRVSRGKNLFSVGDVKQSIYRFRLAQPERFLERYEQFKSPASKAGRVIDLRASFRGRAPLLNVINSVFERLMSRAAAEIEYDQSHRLVAGTNYPAGGNSPCFNGSPVELHLLPIGAISDDDESAADMDLDRTEREAAFIALRIKQLIDSGINVAEKNADGALVLRPIRYRDIVVLLRATKYKSEQLSTILRGSGVPVHSDSGSGFFDTTEIGDLCALLRVLDNPRQDVPLAAVLRSPFTDLAGCEDALAQIRLAFNDREIPFHQAVARYAAEKHDDLAAHLNNILRQLDNWRQIARKRPIAELVWHIYDRTGYLAFCAGMEDGAQRVANLIEFHERARQFGTFQRQGLGRFMQFLNSLQEQLDLAPPSIASQADDVVRIMSIHRAKGLEFPVVIVPDCGKRHNFQDAAGSILLDRQAGIGLMVADETRRVKYPSLAHALVEDRIRRQTLAEEMRVLYVAMTRAREHLILVGSCKEEVPQSWQNDWSRHRGPIPPQRVLQGRTLLDWLGPIAAAMTGAGEKDCIEINWHGPEEVSALQVQAERRATLSESQKHLANLQPLDPAPPEHADALAVIQRLTTPYQFDDLTRVSAATSVGALTKHDQPDFFFGGGAPSSIDLPVPRCAATDSIPAATGIGAATHLVLEHLDFARRCDADDIQLQITELVRRKLLADKLADRVDVQAILWLMGTRIGPLLHQHHAALRRELPIYYPIDPPDLASTGDPRDRIMVRGRVDLLIPDPAGMVIVDYKTDAVTAQTVAARADFYRPQVSAYRQALMGISDVPIKSAVLAFLACQVLIEV